MSERLGRNYQEYNYLLIIQWRNAKLRDPSVKFFLSDFRQISLEKICGLYIQADMYSSDYDENCR